MINVVVATSVNSRYAVHLRSPKPLRASHTRGTLAEIQGQNMMRGIKWNQ